jgi:hypothetical protein
MDRDQLRTVQAPLKEQYRSEPASAVITLRAEGELSSSDVSCSVQTGRALVEAGLHELVATTERYCVVLQTTARTPALSTIRR